ncbi:MAG: hypothetical protein LBU76_07995 [Azoarcus sp.]|nr:hypothetical protein [Azoarcus sp.]
MREIPKKYWLRTCLSTFIVLPLMVSGALAFLGITFTSYWLVPLGLLPLGALAYAICKAGRNTPLPDALLPRFAPFVAPILYTLVIWLLVLFLNGGDAPKGSTLAEIAFLPFFAFVIFHAVTDTFWLLPASIAGAYLFFMACFAVGTWHGKREADGQPPRLPMP